MRTRVKYQDLFARNMKTMYSCAKQNSPDKTGEYSDSQTYVPKNNIN